MTETWWKEAVVYQIYPRSFCDSNGDGIGDLAGIIKKLDYIKTLGANVIWLSPVYQSPNDDNGYDISDYMAIMSEFGTMEEFDLMLGEMHKRDIKLVMDLVVNHTSDEHPWFQAALADRTSKYRDYYFFKDGVNGKEPNNWASHFGFSAWEKEPNGEQYFLHLYTKKQPDLNWDNPAVREEVYNIMQYWIDKGIDGFRMDVINYISKVPELPAMPGDALQLASPYFANGPRVHEYLQEMHERVLKGRNMLTVGEMVSVSPEQARLYTHEDRKELGMVFTFEHMYLDAVGEDKWNLRPIDLLEMKTLFEKWQTSLHGDCWNSLYLNNHDQPRMVSRFGNDGIYRQESAKLLATFLHTLQGTPYVYQGEELGMTNIKLNSINDYKDIDTLNHYQEEIERNVLSHEEIMHAIYTKGRDNSRTPMQWDTSAHAGFTTGTPWLVENPNYLTINAEQQCNDPTSIFAYYQTLIALRKKHKVMIYGDFCLIQKEHPQIFAYKRTYGNDSLLVLLNFSDTPAEIQLDPCLVQQQSLLLSNMKNTKTLEITMALAPYEALVYVSNAKS